MKNFLKNTLLFVAVLIISYFLSDIFGNWYDKFSPQYDNTRGVSKDILISLVGVPLAYIFFVPIFFESSKIKFWLLLPAILYFVAGDFNHIYIPIILAIAGFVLGYLIRKLIIKIRG